MVATIKTRRIAALSMAFGMGSLAVTMLAQASHAQTYVGGGSVIVNLQALDQLGPSYGAASPYGQYPQAYGRPPLPGEANAPKPLFGDSGAKDETIKLRPPRASRAAGTPTRASTGAASAAAVPSSTARPTAAAATQAAPRAERKPADAPTGVTINLPPPSAAGSSTGVSGRPLALPSAQPSAQPSLLAQPGSVPSSAPQTSVTTSPVPAPVPAVTTPAPVAAPAVTAAAPAPVSQAPVSQAPAAGNPASQQTALLTPPTSPAPAARSGGDLVLAFESGKSDLPSGNAQLEALARQLSSSEDRIQIRAYASASGTDAASGARRLSLSRALAVRSYLIDRGVRSTRIDVRALGVPTDGGAPDRVEIATLGR